jgi:hypothetical protein
VIPRPDRRAPVLVRCRCVVESAAPDRFAPGRCPHDATPDSPFCHHCEDRHPQVDRSRWVVDVVPLDDRVPLFANTDEAREYQGWFGVTDDPRRS